VKVAVIVPVPVALGPEKTLDVTTMDALVPVVAEVTVSVAVIVWLPAVFSVALKVPVSGLAFPTFSLTKKEPLT
jgi:hypothetical protein